MDVSRVGSRESLHGRKEKNSRTSSKKQSNPLSSRLYGIDWNRHYPCEIGKTGVIASYSSYEDCVDFLGKHFSLLDSENQFNFPTLPDGQKEAKARYYKEVGDFFEFRFKNQLIGSFVGTPIDWSSYYIRACAIEKNFHNLGIYQGFILKILPILSSHSIARVEVDLSTANLPCVHLFNKLKFNVTSLTSSDRWGTTLRMTKFLDKDREKQYLHRHCHGSCPQIIED